MGHPARTCLLNERRGRWHPHESSSQPGDDQDQEMIRSPGAFFAAHHSRECFPDLLVPLSMRSVLGESALEAGFRSIVELVGLLYDKLPAEHDPVWDTIYLQAEEYFRAAQTGASIGMACWWTGLCRKRPTKIYPFQCLWRRTRLSLSRTVWPRPLMLTPSQTHPNSPAIALRRNRGTKNTARRAWRSILLSTKCCLMMSGQSFIVTAPGCWR